MKHIYKRIFLLLINFCASLSLLIMNRLLYFNSVQYGCPRQQFTELLRVFPTDSLKLLIVDLFTEMCDLNLVLDELCEMSLVNHRDSGLRLISKILSDDIRIL